MTYSILDPPETTAAACPADSTAPGTHPSTANPPSPRRQAPTLEPCPAPAVEPAVGAIRSRLWPPAWVALLVAAVSFHVAWLVPPLSPILVLFPWGVLQLGHLATRPQAFYAAITLGLVCYAPHLGFFWTIFGPAALALWLILAFWLGLVAAVTRFLRLRLGLRLAWIAFPFVWTAAEFFRSELYPLRFSWLSLGYAFSESPAVFVRTGLGLYGVGFLVAAFAAATDYLCARAAQVPRPFGTRALAVGAPALALGLLSLPPIGTRPVATPSGTQLKVAAIQLEYPTEDELLAGLNRLAARVSDAPLIVLSEYTLQEPPSARVRAWCQQHGRHLVVGGKDPLVGQAGDNAFHNTAFVVAPDGTIVFRQVKSVPIQFFQDGAPARVRVPWESPWGGLGLAVCYDLSYRRVMDEFVAGGARALLIPTADDASWGAYQHRLHTRVARVRAAEYNLPILRVAGSGISQFVDATGVERASAPFPGPGEILAAEMPLGARGRLPLDVWLAPLSLLVTLGAITGALAHPTTLDRSRL